MKFKLFNSNHCQVNFFFKTSKLFYVVFFNTKKQKKNILFTQEFLDFRYKIMRLKGMYLKKIIKNSIFNSIRAIFESLFVIISINSNKLHNLNFLNKNKNFYIFSFFIENFCYLKAQLLRLPSLCFLSNMRQFFFTLIKYIFCNPLLLNFFTSNRNNVN